VVILKGIYKDDDPMTAAKIKYLGHAGFQITSGKGKIIIVDPWLTGNPLAPCKLEEIVRADLVLVTHDHFDHVADAAGIVKATGAVLIGAPETVGRLKQEAQIPDAQIVYGMGMNIGGTVKFGDVAITMTQAFHSSQTASPVGYIVKLEDGYTIYHAGDTGIFSSMKVLGELYKIDLAFLPIGGVFTMDPAQAAMAAKLLGTGKVIPMHYKTFPILEQDASSFRQIMKRDLPAVEVIAVDPGQEIAV
jgi:L-ascorbate metabolism protein UlaG (beta-lactamase superfamily)